MGAGSNLYTPEILSAAMELTAYPWVEPFDCTGTARSRSCGSAIDIGLMVSPGGNVTALGIKPHACAIGQAAGAIFAKSALGRDRASFSITRVAIADWLLQHGEMPDWPGLELLEPARAYPARHAAIILAWDAALNAFDQHMASF